MHSISLMLGVGCLALSARAAFAQTADPVPPADPPAATQPPAPTPSPAPPADATATQSAPPVEATTPPTEPTTSPAADPMPAPPADPAPPPTSQPPAAASPQASQAAAETVRAVTLADLPAGATVHDKAGAVVGTVESATAEGAVISTGTVRVRVPIASLGLNARGLLIGMTKAELEAAAAGQSEAAPQG